MYSSQSASIRVPHKGSSALQPFAMELKRSSLAAVDFDDIEVSGQDLGCPGPMRPELQPRAVVAFLEAVAVVLLQTNMFGAIIVDLTPHLNARKSPGETFSATIGQSTIKVTSFDRDLSIFP